MKRIDAIITRQETVMDSNTKIAKIDQIEKTRFQLIRDIDVFLNINVLEDLKQLEETLSTAEAV